MRFHLGNGEGRIRGRNETGMAEKETPRTYFLPFDFAIASSIATVMTKNSSVS